MEAAREAGNTAWLEFIDSCISCLHIAQSKYLKTILLFASYHSFLVLFVDILEIQMRLLVAQVALAYICYYKNVNS